MRRLAASIMRPSCVAAPCPAAAGGFVGLHHRGCLGDLFEGRREGRVHGGELRRMNALLAVEAQRQRDPARAGEAGGIRVRRHRDHPGSGGRWRAPPRRSCASRRASDGRDRSRRARRPRRCRRRACASTPRNRRPEDQRLEPRRRARDLARMEEAARRLDLRFDADPRREPRSPRSASAACPRTHVARRADLRHHQQVDAIAGRLDHLDEVAIGERRIERVDADHADPACRSRSPSARG